MVCYLRGVLTFWWVTSSAVVIALYQEDAGQLDFLIATTGHGPVKLAQAAAADTANGKVQVVVTSDSPSSSVLQVAGATNTASTSCLIAGRSIQDGSLLWRRNVCSTIQADTPRSSSRRHVVAATESPSLIHTLDIRSGLLQTWTADASGSLVWQFTLVEDNNNNPNPSRSSSIWVYQNHQDSYVAFAGPGRRVFLFRAETGQVVDDEKLVGLAQKARPKEEQHVSTTSTLPKLIECPLAKLQVLSSENDDISVLSWKAPETGREGKVEWRTDAAAFDDKIALISLLTCNAQQVSVLLASKRGTTKQITFTVGDDGEISFKTVWAAEEGLGQIQSAFLLDSSHYVGDLDPDSSLRLLQFSSRLQSQWNRLASSLSWWVPMKKKINKNDNNIYNAHYSSRDHAFGFVKTAVLLSPYRVLGMDTVGPKRGQVVYQVDLPCDDDGSSSSWTHRLIHGGPSSGSTSSSTSAAHHAGGSRGGAVTHHREMLVLSMKSSQGNSNNNAIQWTCFDGTTGVVHDRGEASLSSPVVQIMPVMGVLPCRQGALLLLQDGSTAVAVPATDETTKAVASQLSTAPNGFYAHSILGEAGGGLKSFHLSWQEDRIQAQLIGAAMFPGEEIVRVSYPRRDEVIESPCHALGDDSLLLKYLNPHLVVIITMGMNGKKPSPEASEALKNLMNKGKGTVTAKRKPVGVTGGSTTGPLTADTSSSSILDEPNLFVNLVDSVSGRLLYRSSHANALPFPTPTAVMSENWICYSFSNEKTRRAEVGVLSLYEGMIDSKGLTAFTSPDLATSFSSLDARESKPVVLAKTYSISRPVTALGVTLTRSGISSRRLVLASVDGRIHTVDRKSLEPRRPVGLMKDSEKKEGLTQYAEFIPFIPYLTLSYNQTIESVQQILTAPTDLESQTLILAYGGPDIFFARTSPGRGFDLLPDSFNRVMLSLVVLGLLVVTVVLRQRVSRKFVRQGWL